MKSVKIIFFFVLMLSVNNIFSQQNQNKSGQDCSNYIDLSWVKTGGSTISDEALDLAVDNEGNILVTGYFQGQLNFHGSIYNGHTGKDLFIAKLDPLGNLIWIRIAAGSGNIFGTGIDIDNVGNVYITGTFSEHFDFLGEFFSSVGGTDIFLIKLSAQGEYIWGTTFSGFYNDLSGGISVDNDGNIAVIGSYYSSLYLGGVSLVSNGGNDFYAAKFNSQGVLMWVSTDGAQLDIYGRNVTTDHLGNVYVSGEFSGTLVMGSESITANGVFDIFLIKYNANGNGEWIMSVGSAGNVDKAGDLACDIFGNVYVSLYADQPGVRATVRKISPAGTVMNSFSFGNNSSYPNGIFVDNSGDLYLTGHFSGSANFGDGSVSSAGGTDFFLAKFDNIGNFQYKYTAGSSGDDGGTAVGVDHESNIIVSGFNNNSIYFGGTPYPSQGDKDLMIVKFERFFSVAEVMVSSINCDPENMCVELNVTGGIAPYTYLWSDGQTSVQACGLSLGNHSVTIYDSDDCYIEHEFEIVFPEPPQISLPLSVNICPHEDYLLQVNEGFVYYNWNTGENAAAISISVPGPYSITVTDINGCTASASTNVNIYSEPNLLVNDVEYICPGEDISFSIHGFSEYLWSDGTSSSTYTTSSPGQHWVRVFDNTCYFYDTIMIILYPQPFVDIGDDFTMCTGDTAFFDAGEGFLSYLWHDESSSRYYSTNIAELVSVKVTDINGCEAEDAVVVNLMDAPYVYLGQDTTICTNNPVQLSPDDGGGNTYLWSNGSTDSSILAYSSGNYWVQVTNSAGCMSTDTMFLRIYPAISVNIGQDVEFCEGESYTFSVDDIYASYLWSTGHTDTSITVFHTTVISITVTDNNSCAATDSAFVVEHIVIEPFLGENMTVCEGTDIIISPENSYKGYAWNNGSASSELTITESGVYSLTVIDFSGCTSSSSINIQIVENPVIVQVNNNPGYVEIIADGGSAPLTYSHQDTDVWKESGVFTGLRIGSYVFTVRDKYNCFDQVEIEIEGFIDIPSFFTPNGDGYNDVWEVFGIFNYPTAEIQIFDRYGKKLAEFNGTNLRWTGRYQGKLLPSDTYWYVIRLMDGSEPIVGPITLKR